MDNNIDFIHRAIMRIKFIEDFWPFKKGETFPAYESPKDCDVEGKARDAIYSGKPVAILYREVNGIIRNIMTPTEFAQRCRVGMVPMGTIHFSNGIIRFALSSVKILKR